MSTQPQPDPTDATNSLLSSIKVCSDATTGAVIAAMQAAFDEPRDIQRAGAMAATAAQSAAAARDLTVALDQIRRTFPPTA